MLEFHYTDIDKTYQILLAKNGSEVIEDNFLPYTTKVETPYSVWLSISKSEISGEDVMYERLYKVSGDFSLMLKWDELFGASNYRKSDKINSASKTNMMVFLLPWIISWTILPINNTIGSVVSIAVAALTPLSWLVFQYVIYEQISIPIIAGFSLSALLG